MTPPKTLGRSLAGVFWERVIAPPSRVRGGRDRSRRPPRVSLLGKALWLGGDDWLAETVGVVGAELGEGLVGRAVVVRGCGGDEVELVAELQEVLGLLFSVARVEGLDAVGAQGVDQVLHLCR